MWVAVNPSKFVHNFTVGSATEVWYKTSQELTFVVVLLFLIVELCRGWKFFNDTSHNALGSCRLGSLTMLMWMNRLLILWNKVTTTCDNLTCNVTMEQWLDTLTWHSSVTIQRKANNISMVTLKIRHTVVLTWKSVNENQNEWIDQYICLSDILTLNKS